MPLGPGTQLSRANFSGPNLPKNTWTCLESLVVSFSVGYCTLLVVGSAGGLGCLFVFVCVFVCLCVAVVVVVVVVVVVY